MILSYIFGDEITKMEIAPDLITFGSYRVLVINISSVSCPRNLEIWKSIEALAVPSNLIVVFGSAAAAHYVRRSLDSMAGALAAFVLLIAAYLALVAFVYWLFKINARRDLVLLTNGGSLTVFKSIRRRFAVEIIRVLQDVLIGSEKRTIRVDRRRKRIVFADASLTPAEGAPLFHGARKASPVPYPN
jgi:hypothetical protein